MFDSQLYLRRISYVSKLKPTIEALNRLHTAHMRSVPFENLDIQLGRPIELNVDAFFNKIVHQHRGGFCYELNGLFAELLKSVGFKVTMLSARVARQDGTFSPEYDHMTLLVELSERWIADVGFGESFVEPLRLDQTNEQIQYGKRYRILRHEGAFLYQLFDDNSWINQYSFHLNPHPLADFNDMCLFHQTSPDSTFTQKTICSRLTHDGRITLTDKKFIFTSGTKRVETDVEGKEDFQTLLLEHFGIELPADSVWKSTTLK